MKIFITGATGFIGRALVLRLQRDGHEITAWTRSVERARSVLGAEASVLATSAGDDALEAAIATADAVINLSGESIIGGRWNERRRQQLISSRVGVTERLVAAMRRAHTRPKTLISASAVGYYGDRGSDVVDEGSPPGDGFLARLCVDWENAALAAQPLGVRVALVRIGVVLGQGGGALASMLPIFGLGLGGVLGTGEQYMPWIHLEDVVEVFAAALTDSRYRGPVNAVAPSSVTNRDFTRTLGAALHRPTLLRVPRLALRLALGEAAQAILQSQRVRPTGLRERSFQYAFSNLDDALADLTSIGGGIGISAARNVPASTYLQRRKPRYLLEQKTEVAASLEEVFGFFSRAENLGVVTPPSMSFNIVSKTPVAMRPGAVIDYRIRLGRLPLRWRSQIAVWEDQNRFVDVQLKGPYRCWWHEHTFMRLGEHRTLMTDRVYYAPPFGLLGRVANRFAIARQLRQIFGYRTTAIQFRFGAVSSSNAAMAPAQR